MLRQEINLYQQFESPESNITILTWRRFWMLQAFFFIIFMVMGLISLRDIQQLEIDKNSLSKEADTLKHNFYQLKNRYPSFFFSKEVDQSVKQIQSEIESREKILKTIPNPIFFSKIMTTLSVVIVENVWLTNFFIDNGGNLITLKGISLNEASLQQFLDKVLNEKNFSKYTLSIKNIENQGKEKKERLNFEVNMMIKE